jgi:hypothetical protein
MSSRHPGLSKEVWRAVLRRPIGVTFIAADLVDELPSLSNSDSPANVLRAIGAALKSLRLRGGVCVVSYHRIAKGPTCRVSHYQRVADELGGVPVERVELALIAPGVRHVRLQDSQHWHREPSESRPWRGYESGLARIA